MMSESTGNDIRIVVIASCAAAAGGFAWLMTQGISIPNAIVIALCGGAMLCGMLILGTDGWLERLQHALMSEPVRVFAIVAGLWALYLFYAIGTNTVHLPSFAFMAIYLSLPFLLLSRDRGHSGGTWLDAVTILCLWLPIELGFVRRLLIQYAFAEGLAINMGIVAFAAWRRFPGIGYRFEFDRKRILVAVWCFLLFAVIGIPLGFAIHFIGYNFTTRKLLLAPAAFLGIYLFTAIPEELLFRGLIQNWFERVSQRPGPSLILASIVFGASHLNNGPPVPNYKYFVMASIAGVFYGFAWRKTKSLAASAITHALVDTVWSVFFR